MLTTQKLISCECFPLQPFLDNIDINTFVCRIKIIEQGIIQGSRINLPSDELDLKVLPPPRVPKYSTFTKIIVLDNLIGGQVNDTILFLNHYMGTCGASLEYAKIGDEYVIRFEDLIDPTHIEEINQSLNSTLKLVTTSGCINWSLITKETKVIGNIFTSKRAVEVKKFHDRIKELTVEEKNLFYERLKNIKHEEIEYVMLIRKLKEIKDNLNNQASDSPTK